MPFFSPRSTRFDKFTLTVSVGYRNRQKHGMTTHQLEIRVGGGVLEQLGWKIGDRAAVMWGDGKDFGWVRLKHAQDGGSLIATRDRRHGRSGMITTSLVPHAAMADKDGALWRFERDTHPMTVVAFVTTDGSLDIEVPREWFACVKPAKPTKDGNGSKPRVGNWTEVDHGPRWSHQMLEKYDAQKKRRERNP